MAAAPAAPAQPKAEILEFLDTPSRPLSTESLFAPAAPTITIIAHPDPANSKEISITLFPFQTLLDIKLAIYNALDGSKDAIPEYLFLGIERSAGRFEPVEYTWLIPGVSTKEPFLTESPYIVAARADPDTRFVDATGERRILQLVERGRVTIEDMFLNDDSGDSGKAVPPIHAFFYKAAASLIPGPKPSSARDWNGRLYSLFPYVTAGATEPSEEEVARANRLATITKRRTEFIQSLEELLEGDLPMEPVKLTGVRSLRLSWMKQKDTPGVESYFYEVPVNARRPYMRLIPTEGSAISKIHMGEGNIPDIGDPKLLVQWAQERNPIPDRDFVFAKVLLKKGYINTPPIYASLRVMDDGSADYILQPPKGVRRLEPGDDLRGAWATLEDGLKGFSFLQGVAPRLELGNFIVGIKLRKDQAPLTRAMLKKRLPIFIPFFQEISPLPGDTPLLMLRYKAVSNFATEDRVFSFIGQVISRKFIRGEAAQAGLVNLVAEEFQLDIPEARRRVADKLLNQAEAAIVKPETGEFLQQYNPGIDIAIYAQHPFYSIHLTRINSFQAYRRILTLLQIMFNATDRDLKINIAASKELKKAEQEQVLAGAVAPGVVPAAAAAEAEEDGFEEITEEAGAAVAAGAVGITDPAPGAGAVPPATAAPAVAPDLYEEEGGFNDALLDDFAADYGDDLAGDEGGKTLEAAHEEEMARATVTAAEGAARPEPAVAGAAGAAEVAPAAAAAQPATAAGLRQEVRAEAAAAAAAARPDAEEEEEVTVTTTADKSIANYFINKLMEADRRLFNYPRSHPSVKKYVSGCQPTYGRQPAVLTPEKYEEMLAEYKDDDIVFIEYPLMPGEDAAEPAGKESYTVLRFGTTTERQNYYLCSQYFCTRDEILVREKDLMSREMRRPLRRGDGTIDASKLPGQCPFCKGVVIVNKQRPGPNETIIERGIVPKSDNKRHTYIRFLKKTPHPEGFYLPCCFQDFEPIRYSDAQFDKLRELGIPPRAVTAAAAPQPSGAPAEADEPSDDEGEEDEEPPAAAPGRAGPHLESGQPQVDYYTVLQTLGKRGKYILGAEKFPLEIGLVTAAGRGEPQVALLPTALDAYFKQDPTQLVTRSFTQQTLREGSVGFLRVGVENRLRYKADSFLAAVAPFFRMNSAKDVKDRILQVLDDNIKLFLALNYGNLVLEFYDPNDASIERLDDKKLQAWASANQFDWSPATKEALQRLHNSWTAFRSWLISDKIHPRFGGKQYRHFALMFASTGIFQGPGLPGTTFIVLDMLQDGSVKVRCPPYGYNDDIMGKNNVGFLLHHHSGIWEPIFYSDNRSPEQRQVDSATLLFQGQYKGFIDVWPAIVKQRASEFASQCNFIGRSIYTSQSEISAAAMIPLGLAYQILGLAARSQKFAKVPVEKLKGIRFGGVVRDSYNHVAALLLRHVGQASEGYVTLPVADDGTLAAYFKTGDVYLDWDDPGITYASVTDCLNFYKEFIDQEFALYPGYHMHMLAVRGKGPAEPRRLEEADIETLVGIKLRNGLLVPVAAPTSKEEKDMLVASMAMVVPVEEEEWKLNKELAYDQDEMTNPIELSRVELANVNELFEHLRLTFSNYLATNASGAGLRKVIQDLVQDRTTGLAKKRRQLEILLGPTILYTFLTENPTSGKQPSLLRVDCTLRGEGECGGRCSWVADRGRCMLHVPKQVTLGKVGEDRPVSVRLLLLRRLIEELLRFGERRRQIFQQQVSRIANIDKPVKDGAQLILPEKSTEWAELLRLDWAKKADEKPLFLEEMTREPVAAAAAAAPISEETMLPPNLLLRLGGEDPKLAALRLVRLPWRAIFTALGMRFDSMGIPENQGALDKEQLKIILTTVGKGVIQINLTTDDASKDIFYKPAMPSFNSLVLIVITEQGPALVVQDPSAPGPLPIDSLSEALQKRYRLAIAVRKAGVGAA